MTFVHGFGLIEERTITEIDARARIWRHEATGAELLSLCLEDENKVFGVTLRTPPKDSTGVAHILEHSVLCGSEKYPVKEPFVELLKGSLQTFLNAFTYPDKTCYPVASTNLRDFHNLVDVYLDAVFFPRITREIFQQEGWHVEPSEETGNDGNGWIFKGVVFNEMKGAYSSPEGLLAEHCQHSLFPDTTYGLDSGGDPERIPELTYEAFKAFHTAYYHPSNARFFFYGDDPEEERLAILDACLSRFEQSEPDSEVGVQKPFAEPVRLEKTYAADEQDEAGDRSGRTMVCLNWLFPGASGRDRDLDIELALFMLDHVLMGMSASPLRKALTDSGLGEDIVGAGLESELRQLSFSVGLKGVRDKDVDRVEELILETLADLAEKGMPADTVEAAVNTVEFGLRENNTGRFPRGLSLMLRVLTHWLYGGDPLPLLQYEAPLRAVKDRLKTGEKVLEDLIRQCLLDNAHRTTVVLRPDQGLAEELENRERERLQAYMASLGPDAKQELAAQVQTLQEMQETPDSPEDLATIPMLKRTDLNPEGPVIPLEHESLGRTDLLTHDLATGGVVYLDMGFDLAPLPWDLIPLVPLFSRALLETGVDDMDFVELSMRIARKTGGLDAGGFSNSRLDGNTPVTRLFLRGKATEENMDELLDIMQKVLLTARLDSRERVLQMIVEEKARLEHQLIPSGHMFAMSRLAAGFTMAGQVNEAMDGLDQLFYLRELAKEAESDWPAVLARLEKLRELAITRCGAVLNVTSPGEVTDRLKPGLVAFLDRLPDQEHRAEPWAGQGSPEIVLPAHEGLSIPAQVNYVGRAVNLKDAGYEYHGSAAVIMKHLRTGLLWDRIRVRGGAYGAFCMLDRASGVLCLVSYRDPNIGSTIETFDGTGAYLKGLSLSRDELDKAVIGAVGAFDAYLLPDAKGRASMNRWLLGETDEMRRETRSQILAATEKDFRDLGQSLEKVLAGARTVVFGGREGLARIASGDWAVTKVL